MKTIISIFFLLILFSTMMIAQTKFEREYRLKAIEVPINAQDYLIALGANKKIKWYKEISQLGKSIEGKTKIRHSCYSVEFDMEGNLQDVEIEIDWKEIATRTQQTILNYLVIEFDKFKIQKIQRQYTGGAEEIKQALLGQKNTANPTIRYEIVLKGRKNKQVKLYEFLFSQEGALIEFFPIELRNTDNLEY